MDYFLLAHSCQENRAGAQKAFLRISITLYRIFQLSKHSHPSHLLSSPVRSSEQVSLWESSRGLERCLWSWASLFDLKHDYLRGGKAITESEQHAFEGLLICFSANAFIDIFCFNILPNSLEKIVWIAWIMKDPAKGPEYSMSRKHSHMAVLIGNHSQEGI